MSNVKRFISLKTNVTICGYQALTIVMNISNKIKFQFVTKIKKMRRVFQFNKNIVTWVVSGVVILSV